MCDCGEQFCHAVVDGEKDQPCPTLAGDGFNRGKHFLPECESCQCKFAHRAPVVNSNRLFGETCKQNKGEFVSKQCKCAGWNSANGVCVGTDGKIGGVGCKDVEHFVET